MDEHDAERHWPYHVFAGDGSGNREIIANAEAEPVARVLAGLLTTEAGQDANGNWSRPCMSVACGQEEIRSAFASMIMGNGDGLVIDQTEIGRVKNMRERWGFSCEYLIRRCQAGAVMSTVIHRGERWGLVADAYQHHRENQFTTTATGTEVERAFAELEEMHLNEAWKIVADFDKIIRFEIVNPTDREMLRIGHCYDQMQTRKEPE